MSKRIDRPRGQNAIRAASTPNQLSLGIHLLEEKRPRIKQLGADIAVACCVRGNRDRAPILEDLRGPEHISRGVILYQRNVMEECPSNVVGDCDVSESGTLQVCAGKETISVGIYREG